MLQTALEHIAFNHTSLAVSLNNAFECAFECAGVADAGVVYWGEASPEAVKVQGVWEKGWESVND